MASAFTALFDACVLYPFALRDILIQLATTDLFRGRWSPHIHEEWMRTVVQRGLATRERVENTRRMMDASTLECLVTGYEDLIDGLRLPDPDDRHVLAAAIVAGADVIVTKNLKHFPPDAIERYGIEALHPDEFIVHQITLNPVVACGAIRATRARLIRPPYTPFEYLKVMERQDLFRTVAALGPYIDQI